MAGQAETAAMGQNSVSLNALTAIAQWAGPAAAAAAAAVETVAVVETVAAVEPEEQYGLWLIILLSRDAE